MVPETQLHQTRIIYSNVASENQKWQSQKISDYVLQRRFARGRGDGRVMVNIITMAGPGRWVLREGNGHLDPPPPLVYLAAMLRITGCRPGAPLIPWLLTHSCRSISLEVHLPFICSNRGLIRIYSWILFKKSRNKNLWVCDPRTWDGLSCWYLLSV